MLMGLYFSVLLLWFIEFVKKMTYIEMAWIVPKWPTIPINMSKFYIIKCCQAFLAVTLPFKSHNLCLFLLLWLKSLKVTLFFMPINQDQFWGSNAKVCVTWPIHADVNIVVSDFQQKYVVLKAMRRSGVISKDLSMKNWN